jgi:hypothetical protein
METVTAAVIDGRPSNETVRETVGELPQLWTQKSKLPKL